MRANDSGGILHCSGGLVPPAIRRMAWVWVPALSLCFAVADGLADDSNWALVYASSNLAGHLVSAECWPAEPDPPDIPCGASDVGLVSTDRFGSVIANVLSTTVYVNAIAAQRFTDMFPDGRPLNLDVFKYRADLRCPVLPFPSTSQTQNPQAAHMMIQLWDGAGRLWSNDHVALEATALWALNAWTTNTLGKLYVYTSSDTGALELVDTGLCIAPDTNWHTVEFVADFVHTNFVSIRFDDQLADLSAVQIARLRRPDWGDELLYHITQESCSVYPGPAYDLIFQWTMLYRNVDFSRLAFRVDSETRPDPGTNEWLSWLSEPFMKYGLKVSGDLLAWSNAAGVSTGTGARLDLPAPADSRNRRYYRLQIAP